MRCTWELKGFIIGGVGRLQHRGVAMLKVAQPHLCNGVASNKIFVFPINIIMNFAKSFTSCCFLLFRNENFKFFLKFFCIFYNSNRVL